MFIIVLGAGFLIGMIFCAWMMMTNKNDKYEAKSNADIITTFGGNGVTAAAMRRYDTSGKYTRTIMFEELKSENPELFDGFMSHVSDQTIKTCKPDQYMYQFFARLPDGTSKIFEVYDCHLDSMEQESLDKFNDVITKVDKNRIAK
jgi:hypothetical protein